MVATRKLILLALAVFLAGVHCATAQVRPIGGIRTAKDAKILRAGAQIIARIGASLHEKDTLVTGPAGNVGIVLKDNSVITLGPGSRMTLTKFAFAPQEGKLGLLNKIYSGSMEYISGKIAKIARDAAKFNTPFTTVAVRGTRLLIRVEGLGHAEIARPGDTVSPVSVGHRQHYGPVIDIFTRPKNLIVLLKDPQGHTGAVEVSTGAGKEVLSKSGQATGVSGQGESPRAAFNLGKAKIDELFGDAIKARPILPASFTLYFELNRSTLTPAAQELVKRIVAEVRRRPVSSVSIYGHADSSGNAGANMRISLDRANKVRDSLTALGLDSKNFMVDSFGDHDPVVRTAKGVAEPRNRRVEIVIR